MDYRNYKHKRRETGHIWAGVFLLLAGAAWILHEEGLIIPDIFYNWHLLVAGIGLFIGFARNFRGIAWLVITAIGAVGLVEDYYSLIHIQAFIWPCFIILIGLLLIFRRRRPWEAEWEAKWRQRKAQWQAQQGQWHQTKREWRRQARKEWRDAARDVHDAARDWRDHQRSGRADETVYSDEKVDIAASFGTFRKKMVSKNFRGGYVVTFLGNTEIDLHEADFFGTIRLDVTQIMGTTTITVPEHWEVRPDLNAIFADFRDRRAQPAMSNPEKVLVLSGKSVFGSIEVRSRPVVE
jgi:predicted membrane protein